LVRKPVKVGLRVVHLDRDQQQEASGNPTNHRAGHTHLSARHPLDHDPHARVLTKKALRSRPSSPPSRYETRRKIPPPPAMSAPRTPALATVPCRAWMGTTLPAMRSPAAMTVLAARVRPVEINTPRSRYSPARRRSSQASSAESARAESEVDSAMPLW